MESEALVHWVKANLALFRIAWHCSDIAQPLMIRILNWSQTLTNYQLDNFVAFCYGNKYQE